MDVTLGGGAGNAAADRVPDALANKAKKLFQVRTSNIALIKPHFPP